MRIWGSIKNFFGFFSLNEFEKDIVNALRESLDPKWKEVLDSQLKRFNKLDRVISSTYDLPFGHTSFYWVRLGKPRFDFPKKFPLDEGGEELASLQVVCENGQNVIDVSFVCVKGFLFTIKYRSPVKQFLPNGSCRIQNVVVLPGYS